MKQKSAMHHILSQFIPIHVISSYPSKICFNIIFPFTTYIPNHFLHWYFRLKYYTSVNDPPIPVSWFNHRKATNYETPRYIYVYSFPHYFFFLKYRYFPEHFPSLHVVLLNWNGTFQTIPDTRFTVLCLSTGLHSSLVFGKAPSSRLGLENYLLTELFHCLIRSSR